MRPSGDCTKAIQPLFTLVETSGLTISSKLPSSSLIRAPMENDDTHIIAIFLGIPSATLLSIALILAIRFCYRPLQWIEVPNAAPTVTTNQTDSTDGFLLQQWSPRIVAPVPQRLIPIERFIRDQEGGEILSEETPPIILERRPPTPPRGHTPIIIISPTSSPDSAPYAPQSPLTRHVCLIRHWYKQIRRGPQHQTHRPNHQSWSLGWQGRCSTTPSQDRSRWVLGQHQHSIQHLLPLRLWVPWSLNPSPSRLQKHRILESARTEPGAHTQACTTCQGTCRQLLNSPSLSSKVQLLAEHPGAAHSPSFHVSSPTSNHLGATRQPTPRAATASTRATRALSATVWTLANRDQWLGHRLRAMPHNTLPHNHFHWRNPWKSRAVPWVDPPWQPQLETSIPISMPPLVYMNSPKMNRSHKYWPKQIIMTYITTLLMNYLLSWLGEEPQPGMTILWRNREDSQLTISSSTRQSEMLASYSMKSTQTILCSHSPHMRISQLKSRSRNQCRMNHR